MYTAAHGAHVVVAFHAVQHVEHCPGLKVDIPVQRQDKLVLKLKRQKCEILKIKYVSKSRTAILA